MKIFNNEISDSVYKKAVKGQKKFIKKYGDDRKTNYSLKVIDNEILNTDMNVKNFIIADNKDESLVLPEKSIIIGNIRMGFGHYRISMAMASAAHSMGYTPLWLDLNSFPETTCTKIISSQNNLYSLGSRLSQKYSFFNKLIWEPLNYEGFKKLNYNVGDQKNAELMTSLFNNIPKDVPFIATHVWPSQAAVHSGMTKVVNAIPDNWPMALHLSEGSLHTVQTFNSYFGYRTLHGFEKNKVLNPIPEKDILYTGHYIDHEIVENIEKDCEKRCQRVETGKPLRFLITIGGAGAQGEFFKKIISFLMPYIKENKACLYINCGDYENVWNNLKKELPELQDSNITKTYFNTWKEECSFAENSIAGNNDISSYGIHAFCNKNIFSAVYITNLLMRGCDVLITKPSELAFYPVPKLFIKRVGGHEMWGAIHSAEIGDGTQECETPEYACEMIKLMLDDSSIIKNMCSNIIRNKKDGIYDGAYNVIKAAVNR